MKNPQIILTKKDKQDVIIIGMGQTMHRASLSEPRRQTVNKFNYRKKDMPDNSRNRTKNSFWWMYNGFMQSYTMKNKIILCRLNSEHAAINFALIWLQIPRVGHVWIWWVIACITAQSNVIFITNRIFPIQYWEQISLVEVLRDNKLSYFLSADRWFLGVYFSKEKVLFKKLVVIHTWGLKHPRKSKR